MYKGLLNTFVQPLFFSLNHLFGGAAPRRRGLLQTPSTLRRRNLKTLIGLFLRLRGLRSRVIRHEKAPQTGGICKFSCGKSRDFPGLDFLKQKYKTTRDCCVLKALANEDTLLPTQMFPRLPARATFVADKNFVILFRNILCLQQMFPSLRSMETQHSFCVPRVCAPKKHHEQHCVLVCQGLKLPSVQCRRPGLSFLGS